MLTRVLAGVGVVAIVLGAGWLLINGVGPRTPEAPALVEQIREVARLETLEVRLYKRVSFALEPTPAATVWGDVLNWVKQSLAGKSGRAIVFADVSLGLSLDKLTAENVHVRGSRVEVALPPLHAQVALRPEETEIIDSNLDSAQTAKLFELAKDAFEREVEGDAALQKKARASAERAVRGVLMSVGFREVVFVPWPTT